jgi:hypothetical protein
MYSQRWSKPASQQQQRPNLYFAHFSARSLSVSLKPGMCFETADEEPVVEVIICHSVWFADVEDNN